MFELKVNLPNWFLIAVAAYFGVKVAFGILSIWVKRKQFKSIKLNSRRR